MVMILPMARRCPAPLAADLSGMFQNLRIFCADFAQTRRAIYPRELPALASRRVTAFP